MYKLFPNRTDNLLDALGLNRLLPWRRSTFTEFWALRGIDLNLGVGERIGIIGRNGSGKTTLLKLVTGNFQPTEGKVAVNGKVQALMDAGAGFHPEFTGYENIRASLTYHGLTPARIEEAIEEIAEFTELGQFLGQPFKTYSAGMQARLTFATATTINPEILIVDEILGTGDGYFIHKSSERVQKLIMNGATVLVVSHSSDQILKLCEKAIWIDRGRIVEQGPALEVVKAYEQFLRMLNDRRLRMHNVRQGAKREGGRLYGDFHDCIQFILIAPRGNLRVSEVTLLEDGEALDRLGVGEPQDSSSVQSSFVQTDAPNRWSSPEFDGRRYYRSVSADGTPEPFGCVLFYVHDIDPARQYAAKLQYSTSDADCMVRIWTKDGLRSEHSLPATNGEWKDMQLSLTSLSQTIGTSKDSKPDSSSAQDSVAPTKTDESSIAVRRWPGENSLMLSDVRFLNDDGRECGVFEVGMPMTMTVKIVAREAGKRRVIPACVVFKKDGTLVSKLIGTPVELDVQPGDLFEARLDFGPLNLGNGPYVVTVSIHYDLDYQAPNKCEWYDLLAHSYEFEVSGNPPLLNHLFQHRGSWSMRPLRKDVAA
jgi:lipopolysaccharide transport system ATP-binding protein